jgi:DNA-binding transcriptional LysR family regulator
MAQQSDIGILRTTLVLLDEQHVTRAAERLHLSVSATSRALDRSRQLFNDALLVRQGRNVVITPHGELLRDQIRPLLAAIDALFEPTALFDPRQFRGTFVIRASEAVMAGGGVRALTIARAEAPRSDVRFEPEAADDVDALRSGSAALAIGGYGELPADIASEHLVDEQLVGAVRSGHPCLKRPMTAHRFSELEHVVVSRRGIARGPIDVALEAKGLSRTIAAVLPSFAAALAMAAQSEVVAIAPRRLASVFSTGAGLEVFEIPVPIPAVDVRQIWHHRLNDDPTHGWLRSCVRRAVGLS